ncbi:MAG: transposase [Thaumarchaeota archaeon]|nr:transposase [Nitrososphaerota archaeon]
MRLLTVVPELECFLNRFRNLMSRIRFRHFCRYIIGLAASDRKSIRRIAVSCQERVDQSNLNRFIHSDAIDDNSIQARVMDMVWRNIAKRRPSGRLKVFLIIDDSLLQKFGTHMEGAGYIFSTKEHRSILCHDVVTSFMVAGGMGYPVDVRLYVKEDMCGTMGVPFKTRIELAGELIKSFRVPP